MIGADLALLAVAAVAAGALNAIAGGGSFLTFPALVAVGVPPIAANATSAMAVSPGYLGSTLGFRAELAQLPAQRLWREALLAAGGGLVGAALLLVTPASTFRALVPWLLLFATALFALAPHLLWWRARSTASIGAGYAQPAAAGTPPPAALACAAPTSTAPPSPWWQPLGLFAVSVYGGYFNGGLGILLMALYALAGEPRVHTANALKNLNSLVLSLLSVAAFALAGVIVWPYAVLMMVAATAGGYVGARLAQRLPARTVRGVVVATGVAMTAVFFARS
ncbi:sulfite exporter TauE/SafE family protein [Tepidimonas charontis]|uniref:Probable membrane transporter protein n=1 Tax=Tepidimonas charontis TaxID=2267262 RepID=A0A554X600_9BURK|nr:sulfite exporter TauE/SafE family protein [Tepidimonas charontis]TSE31259.1 Sulfite exporter TauE/SafE [Tepidimonas charontis]